MRFLIGAAMCPDAAKHKGRILRNLVNNSAGSGTIKSRSAGMGGRRWVYLVIAAGLLLSTFGQPAARAAARDEECYWQGFDTYLDEVDFLGALGCRLNDQDEWVEGVILADDQYLVDVPSKSQDLVEEFVESVLDEIDRMLADPRIAQLYAYDLDTGELEPGPDFYRNSADFHGTIDMAGQPLVGPVEGPTGGSYEDAVTAYLRKPGTEALRGYVGWYISWRDTGIESAVEGHYGNIRYKDALYRRAQYESMPKPWQLADVNALTVCALWLIETYGTD